MAKAVYLGSIDVRLMEDGALHALAYAKVGETAGFQLPVKAAKLEGDKFTIEVTLPFCVKQSKEPANAPDGG